MGYYVTVEADLTLAKEHLPEALAAINALHTPDLLAKQAGGGSSHGDKWYAWVGNPPEGGWTDIVVALREWRYDAHNVDDPWAGQEEGDVYIESFCGTKWGDDAYLWRAIAPFVRSGSVVSYIGEDGEQWRYVFEDGKVVRPATVTVIQNGVLVQDHWVIEGTTFHKKRAEYQPHADKLPLKLQDHGNPTRFRNVWVRELSN